MSASISAGGGVRSAFSAPAMARTMAAIQIAPPGPKGATASPASRGKPTCPTRLPMSRTASACERHWVGTAVAMSVIVSG